MITAFGTGIHDDFDISKLRYDKIIIMTDADVDGAHIATLMLTFLYRFMPELIKQGHVYLAKPPLFKVEKNKKIWYAYNDDELDKILAEIGRDGSNKIPVSYTHLDVYKRQAIAGLNPKYTFSTFVVGSNNKFAHAASLAVAESPGEIYNPLFLYGGVGLGKTHLMHSIAHFIIERKPGMKILYVTSEEFTNEVIEAIRNGNNRCV